MDEPRLADAGLAEHGREPGLAVGDRAGQPVPQPAQLLVPVDQGRVQADGQGPGADRRRQQPEPAVAGRLDLDRPRGQPAGLVADQDLAGRRQLGQLDGLADGVAGEAGRVGTADQGLAGGQADPHPQGQAALLVEDGGLGLERAPGGQRRLGGPQGVVLVQDRDAEDPDDALADRCRQLPSVPFQGGAEDGLGPFQHHPERLGVQPRARAGGDPQLGAQHRHRLARRHRGRGGGGAGAVRSAGSWRRIAVSSSPRAGAGSRPSSSSSSSRTSR